MINNLNKLVEKYLKAKDAYYNAVPIISDVEFDALEKQIEERDPNHPALQIVGYSIKNADKVQHTVPMLSMEKAMKQADLVKWLKKRNKNECTSFVATNKLDGMSCELRYKDGVLEQAITRGDGEVGRNITAKVRHIVPNVLPSFNTLAVRGELLMAKKSLEELNKIVEEPLSNPRNGVGGVINEDAISVEKLKFIEFKAFELLNAEKLDFVVTYQQSLELLQILGFSIPHFRVMHNIDDVKAVISHFTLLREQDEMLWDGVVFRVNDLEYAESLGRTAKFWKRAVAFKFPTEMTTVVIKEIEWSIGTTSITPVAIFEPVFLSGANISRASLKSVKNMIEVGAYLGAEVSLVRSGEVIPYIQRCDLVYDKEKTKEKVEKIIPRQCSVCGELTTLSPDYTLLKCRDPNCHGYFPRQLEKFVKGLHIKHIGPALCKNLIDLNMVNSLADILKVEEYLTPSTIAILGPEITNRMLREIDVVKNNVQPEYKVLGNIGIYNVGEQTAKEVLEKVGSIDDLLIMAPHKLQEKMSVVFPGIVEEVCSSLESKRIVLQELKDNGMKWGSNSNKENSGITVVITGALEGMTRNEFKKILDLNGVKMASSVSKNVDYLITNAVSNSSKRKKAEALGISIVNQHKFLEILGA